MVIRVIILWKEIILINVFEKSFFRLYNAFLTQFTSNLYSVFVDLFIFQNNIYVFFNGSYGPDMKVKGNTNKIRKFAVYLIVFAMIVTF